MKQSIKTLWQTRVSDFKKSGNTAVQYSRDNNFNVRTFYRWIQRFNKDDSIKESKSKFNEVYCPTSSPSSQDVFLINL